MMYVFGKLPRTSKWRYLFAWSGSSTGSAIARAKQDAAAHGMAFDDFAAVPSTSTDRFVNLKHAAEQLGCVTLRMDEGAQVIRIYWLPGMKKFRFILNGAEIPEFVVQNIVTQNYDGKGA